jgi:exodeoxyribonuclease V gamma subunit
MLLVHRAEQGGVLADELARLISEPLPDPFDPEVVAVPARGVERWLTQRLSLSLGVSAVRPLGDGVCANISFPSLRQLLDGAVPEGFSNTVERLAMWEPARLTWPVLASLEQNLHEDWCRMPRHYLYPDGDNEDSVPDRRLGFAARVARLFNSYAHSRPEMLARWSVDDYTFADGSPMSEPEQWQPGLWRSVVDQLGGISPVELHRQLVDEVSANPDLVALPYRFSVFGPSRMSRRDLEMLRALAGHRNVHLWLHHSSPALWDSVSESQVVARRSDDDTIVVNPLLRSMSRDVRELQMLLRAHAPNHKSVLHDSPDQETDHTLLRRIRTDIAADRVPAAPETLPANDFSIQVHACHGRTRQVEVLREVVVGLLADDPTLEPRDVLIMCPDIEMFAPLLSAAFAPRSPGEQTHPAEQLRVHIADRALHQTNPVLAVLSALLEFGTARHTANEVLGLAELPAVSRRFDWADETGEQIREWARAAGVRWGLNAADRGEWRLGILDEGTWRRGFDRVLLGAVFEGGIDRAQPIAQLLPIDDIDSSDLEQLGRFAEFLDRIDAAQSLLSEPHTATEWANILHEVTTALAQPDPDAPWQALQVGDLLREVLVDNPAGAASELRLTLQEIRPALREALAGHPTRAGFRTGALTVCELVPMRSVPHRVVIVLGLDDGAFPRQSVRDGDDFLARDPWIGDRDPRSEDRQLLLDAIGAAQERFIVIYTGHDPRTGAPVPPAVPLGELLDAIDSTVVGSDDVKGRDLVTTHHPLQPFDPRAFISGALGTARPFSFDPRGLAGAVSASHARSDPRTLAEDPLPTLAPADIELDDLVALLSHPVRGFLIQRLRISSTRAGGDLEDSLPLELDALERWALGDRMLRQLTAGRDASAVTVAELGRGGLPPGPLGIREIGAVGPRAEAIVRAAAELLVEEPESYEVEIDLGDNTRLVGTIGNVRGTCLTAVSYAHPGPRHRLAAWLRLLALTVAFPDQPWRAVTLGLGENGLQSARSTFRPVPADSAAALIGQYVDLYRAGLNAPLPVPLATAEEYALRRSTGVLPPVARTAAARLWNDGWQTSGEQSDDAHALLFGAAAPIDVLVREEASADDYFRNWPSDEGGDRFGVLSRRFWAPLLQYETRDAV